MELEDKNNKKSLFIAIALLLVAIMSVLFVEILIQIIACSTLAAYVGQYYYASCITCNAQSYSFMPIIFFIAFAFTYLGLSYWLYNKYAITFKQHGIQ